MKKKCKYQDESFQNIVDLMQPEPTFNLAGVWMLSCASCHIFSTPPSLPPSVTQGFFFLLFDEKLLLHLIRLEAEGIYSYMIVLPSNFTCTAFKIF